MQGSSNYKSGVTHNCRRSEWIAAQEYSEYISTDEGNHGATEIEKQGDHDREFRFGKRLWTNLRRPRTGEQAQAASQYSDIEILVIVVSALREACRVVPSI